MFEFQELTKPALFTLFGRDVTAYALFLTLGVLIGVLYIAYLVIMFTYFGA